MACVGCSFNSFFSLFAVLHNNKISWKLCFPVSIFQCGHNNEKKLYFIQVNCMGWQVWIIPMSFTFTIHGLTDAVAQVPQGPTRQTKTKEHFSYQVTVIAFALCGAYMPLNLLRENSTVSGKHPHIHTNGTLQTFYVPRCRRDRNSAFSQLWL